MSTPEAGTVRKLAEFECRCGETFTVQKPESGLYQCPRCGEIATLTYEWEAD